MAISGTTRTTAAAIGSLIWLALLLPLATPAQADFASQCAAPTRTISGDRSESLNIASGETLLLTGGAFSGGIDAFPAGSTLCVAPSAALTPPYMNNAAGALVVASGAEVTLPSTAVATGFSLENEGTVTGTTFNINGAASIHNLDGGTLTFREAFSPANGAVVNDGEMEVRGDYRINGSASLENNDALRVTGALFANGGVHNTGTLEAEAVEVNGSGTLHNECVILAQGALRNDSSSSLNEGYVVAGAGFTNNGTWRQTLSGAVASDALSNDGTVTGFGRFRVTGDSRTQGTFTGDSAASPIVVDDTTPPTPPQIFDLQSGTVANVVTAAVSTVPPGDYPTPNCSGGHVRPSADLDVSKSGPSTVEAGETITYTVTITNHGPTTADGVEIVDELPNALTAVTASDGGTVAGGEVSWQLDSVAPGATVTRTVTGTAPASGTLVNVVRGTSGTPDPDPSNNDGTSPAAEVTTEVTAPPPVNEPPVATPATYDTFVGRGIADRLAVSDPDAGQHVRTTLQTAPSNGRAVVSPSGLFGYVPEDGFTGVDTFTYEVCDNFEPAACDTATITINVRPVAVDDTAETTLDTPVDVPQLANDLGDDVIVTIATAPANGVAVVLPDDTIRYTPGTGYLGTDTLTYRICAAGAPTLCAEADVDLSVVAPNAPPVVPDELLRTVTEQPVEGTLRGTDPDGDTVSYVIAQGPSEGTATISGSRVTYRPGRGFSGHDEMGVIVCDDGTPSLCSSGTVRFEVSPLATDDSARTLAGESVDVDSLANDKGADGDRLIVEAPADGTVVWRDGRFVYTPAEGFTGTDRFTYRICSPAPDPLCSEAAVTIVVEAPPTDDGGSTDDGAATDDGGSTGGDGWSSGDLADAGGPAAWLAALAGLLVAVGAGLLSARRSRGSRRPAGR